MSVADWNPNPALNTAIGGVNIAEGCPAGNLNNAIRQIMSQAKVKFIIQDQALPTYPLPTTRGGTGAVTPADGLAALGGLPIVLGQVQRSDSFSFSPPDGGKVTYWTGPAGIAGLPANATIAMPVGTRFEIVNYGSGALQFRPGDGPPAALLRRSPGGASGYFSLAVGGWAMVLKVEPDLWFIRGDGLS